MKKLCDIVVVSDRHIYNEARSSKGGNENVRDSSDRQDSSTAADRSDGHRGIGIGLSICKTIIRAHGGDITAVNHGKGAEFIFTLPKEKEE